MHESFDVTTIIFAVLAIFVLYKLRSVLGTRTGSERPPTDPFRRQGPEAAGESRENGHDKGEEKGNVIAMPGITPPPASSPAALSQSEKYSAFATEKAWNGLDAIIVADPSFQARSFLDGARVAYEMIVTAFAAGNRDALRSLLSKEVYDSFAGAIDVREARGESVETTFVSIDKAMIDDALLRGDTAQISIDFLSKLITVTREKSGGVIQGSPDKVVDVVDIWTFAREVRARDPNWKVVATGSSH